MHAITNIANITEFLSPLQISQISQVLQLSQISIAENYKCVKLHDKKKFRVEETPLQNTLPLKNNLQKSGYAATQWLKDASFKVATRLRSD